MFYVLFYATMLPRFFLHNTKQPKQKSNSAVFPTDLQFGMHRAAQTGISVHWPTPSHSLLQFRQRFPLCFPEFVCRKSMAVDLGRGPYAERVTQGMGELAVRKMEKINIYMHI